MAYDVFLLVMSQLAGRRKARVVIQGEVFFFEVSDKKNCLTLYTKIYSGEGDLPPSVRSCVSSSGVLRWQQRGAFLKLDSNAHCVYLFQEVEMAPLVALVLWVALIIVIQIRYLLLKEGRSKIDGIQVFIFLIFYNVDLDYHYLN